MTGFKFKVKVTGWFDGSGWIGGWRRYLWLSSDNSSIPSVTVITGSSNFSCICRTTNSPFKNNSYISSYRKHPRGTRTTDKVAKGPKHKVPAVNIYSVKTNLHFFGKLKSLYLPFRGYWPWWQLLGQSWNKVCFELAWSIQFPFYLVGKVDSLLYDHLKLWLYFTFGLVWFIEMKLNKHKLIPRL